MGRVPLDVFQSLKNDFFKVKKKAFSREWQGVIESHEKNTEHELCFEVRGCVKIVLGAALLAAGCCHWISFEQGLTF